MSYVTVQHELKLLSRPRVLNFPRIRRAFTSARAQPNLNNPEVLPTLRWSKKMTDNIPLTSWEGNSNHGVGSQDRSQVGEVPSPTAGCAASGPERSQLTFKGLITDWARECVAVIFSVLCMAAIAIIALNIDGIQLSQWHLDLQPSTVLSILTTACQSSLMFSVAEIIGFSKWFYFMRRSRYLKEFDVFDSASRGPLGSLNLLRPGRSGLRPWIAYTGASITILALAMGPFSQQIISLRDSQVLLTQANSTTFVTNTWPVGSST